MLPRVLEPEVMDTVEEAQDYDSMDHAEVNFRFAEDALAALRRDGYLAMQEPCHALDLGTGTAQIPIEMIRQVRLRGETLRLTAVDLAAEMLVLAKRNVAAVGMTDAIRLERLDAKTLPYPDERFTAVVSNSIVHHIPEPREALAEAARVTAPGGRLFFRDLLRPDALAELTRLVDLYAAGAGERQRQLFAQSLHAALTVDEIRIIVGELGFAPDTVQATSDRHWTWSARKP